MRKRLSKELVGDPADVAFFQDLLASHRARCFVRLMRLLPTDPRCRICRTPFGGRVGGLLRRVGRGPSRKNPTMCGSCFEQAPMYR